MNTGINAGTNGEANTGANIGEQIAALRAEAAGKIAEAASVRALDDIKVGLLGKKSPLAAILRSTGSLSAEERPLVGKLSNEARAEIEGLIEKKAAILAEKEIDSAIERERLDVTLPGKRAFVGHKHPMTLIIEEITELFAGMGFTVAEGPEIETDYYNFEALNIPYDHPAKDEQDTFYINGQFLLRTQTSGVQARTMERTKPPIRIIAPGKIFRADEPDATHTPVFHQCEGLYVDKGVTFAHLSGTLDEVAKRLFGNGIKTRFRPSYFPFTEPSAEMDVSCHVCGGKGCGVCKGSGWIEMLGCGMVHPNVLMKANIDPNVYSGFAFGMGLERFAASRYGINDIRLMFENDVRFLSQF